MKSVRSPLVQAPGKAPTGVAGFDAITGGGLPRGRTTLLAEGIFMTPTLVKLAPSPARRIVGTLGQTQTVLQALDLNAIAA